MYSTLFLALWAFLKHGFLGSRLFSNMDFLAPLFFLKVGFLTHVLKFIKKLEIHKKKKKKRGKFENFENGPIQWTRNGPYVGLELAHMWARTTGSPLKK